MKSNALSLIKRAFGFTTTKPTHLNLSAKATNAWRTAGQDFVGVAPVTLVFAVNQKKLEKIDPGHAGEIMKSADVGAMMQNALLACSAMGLAAVPRVWFDPQAVLDAMGKTMAEYEPRMAVTVGFAA